MDREQQGGWVYIMSNRYRGTLYVGSTADLPLRVSQHRTSTGSKFCAEHGLTRLVWAEFLPTAQEALDHEKRLKRWLIIRMCGDLMLLCLKASFY